MRKLFILDERWNSALTDLGIKMASVSRGEVACAVLEGFPAEKMVRERGLRYFYIADPRKGLPFKPFFSLKRVLEMFKPDVVVTIRGDELLFSSILKNRYGFKLYRLHGEAKGIRNTFMNRYIHREKVDGVIVSTAKNLNGVVLNVPNFILHGAVDTQRFRFSKEGREKIRKELGIGDSLLLGVVGRLDPVKGHDLFIKALSLLNKNGLNVKGLIVGEEKNVKVDKLKSLAKRLGIVDSIIFITKRRKDIVDIMSAFDVGIVPSKGSEVIARTLLELMACGKPVVVTNVGVLPEVVKENFGTVVKPKDEDLYIGVKTVLNRNLEALGKAAREEAVENYSLNRLSTLVNSLFI